MDIFEKIVRYDRFYAAEKQGCFLLAVDVRNEKRPEFDLRTYDFTKESEHRRYWADLVDRAHMDLEYKRGLATDFIDGIVLHYGFGAFGAIYSDVDLIYTYDTSYLPHQLMESYAQMEQFRYSADHFYSHIFVEAERYLTQQAGSDFMVQVYPCPSPLDVVNLLRGNDLFTDFYEYPDELTACLENAREDILKNHKNICVANCGPFTGVYAFGKYVPKGICLLEDAADLSSPEVYNQFGRPHTEYVLREAGGGYLHHHALGKQQFTNMNTLQNLTIQQISTDPSAERPVDHLDHLYSQLKTPMPVDFEVLPEDIYEKIDELSRWNFIFTTTCDTLDDAKRLIDFVQRHNALEA